MPKRILQKHGKTDRKGNLLPCWCGRGYWGWHPLVVWFLQAMAAPSDLGRPKAACCLAAARWRRQTASIDVLQQCDEYWSARLTLNTTFAARPGPGFGRLSWGRSCDCGGLQSSILWQRHATSAGRGRSSMTQSIWIHQRRTTVQMN